MESQEVLDNVIVSNGSVASSSDEIERVGNGVKKSENVSIDIVDDLDLYLKEIDDRLTISRMVSDSVVRGMVHGVEQVAADKVAAKELELENLKGSLGIPCRCTNRVGLCEPDIIGSGQHLSLTDRYVEHERMKESFCSLKYDVREQVNKLKKEIDAVKGWNSVRKISSSPELVGLSGILKEKDNGSWIGVDRIVDGLHMTMETIIKHFDNTLDMFHVSRCELQQEQEFQGDVEAAVMRTVIRNTEKEFKEELLVQNAKFCQSQSEERFGKFNEISSLRKELDVIAKLLGSHESEALVSYGSGDFEHSYRKGLNNIISFQTTHREGNGMVDEPETDMTGVFDASRFKHMDRDQLEKHFAIMMRNSKREHESIVQRLTEECISLKGKYLNKMGSSKDKDFDILKRKIPEVISKLDYIIADYENLSAFCDNTFSCFKGGLDKLLLENQELRNLQSDKNNELKSLSSQFSDATEKILQHSSAEEIFSSSLANLSSSMEDAIVETSVREEVYKCILRELSCFVVFDIKSSESKSVKDTNQCQLEDYDIELLIAQQIGEVTLRESIKNATGKLKELYCEYTSEKNNRVSLEMEVSEKEKTLVMKVVENEKLKQEAVSLAALVEEKDKLADEVSVTLMKKNEQLDFYYQELNDLRDYIKGQQQTISDTCLELDTVKDELNKALEQIEVNEMEISSLSKHLELQMRKLEEAEELKRKSVALSEARQNDLSLLEAKEKSQRKQMEAIILFADAMSEQFTQLEGKVANTMNLNNSRLEYSRSHLKSLFEKAGMLTKAELQFKQKLERRCNDLKLAEAEVDLLGDEVEQLLGLLEKIYTALDHYSPVLLHYPGIIEILKMVRRELSGETSKSL